MTRSCSPASSSTPELPRWSCTTHTSLIAAGVSTFVSTAPRAPACGILPTPTPESRPPVASSRAQILTTLESADSTCRAPAPAPWWKRHATMGSPYWCSFTASARGERRS
jgi:hypothetical protein